MDLDDEKKPNILAFLKEVVTTANKRSYAYFSYRKILAFIQESGFYYFLLCNGVTSDEHFGLFAR